MGLLRLYVKNSNLVGGFRGFGLRKLIKTSTRIGCGGFARYKSKLSTDCELNPAYLINYAAFTSKLVKSVYAALFRCCESGCTKHDS